jgi:hypothetical protein
LSPAEVSEVYSDAAAESCYKATMEER